MIYLLEDDDSIRKLVMYTLESQGYHAEGFSTPSAFWQAMRTQRPRLILLDVMLPEEDGLSVLKKLRSGGHTMPVILLTAKNTEYDRVLGLDHGADDFISKPFGMMELLARIRAVLRRAEPAPQVHTYQIGPLLVLPDRRQVFVSEQEITLTHKEFALLLCLLEQQGRVLTRDQLMDRVWGLEADRENRTLDVHIRTLRMKLGEAGNLIETVRGIGYRIGVRV